MRTSLRSLSLGLVVTLATGGLGAGLLSPASAGAAKAKGRTVTVGGNVRVTLVPGWSAGKAKGGKLAITHNNPHAVLEVVLASKVSGKVSVVESNNLTEFVNGFGLTNTRVTGQQSGAISGSKLFTEAASAAYSGTFKGTTLGGLAVEFENPKSGAAVFAVVVAPASSQSTLSKSVMAMIESIATNP